MTPRGRVGVAEVNDIAKQHPDVIARIETFLKKARSHSPVPHRKQLREHTAGRNPSTAIARVENIAHCVEIVEEFSCPSSLECRPV